MANKLKTVTTESVINKEIKVTAKAKTKVAESKEAVSYSVKHVRVEFVKAWESFSIGDKKLVREDFYNKAKEFVKIIK